MQLNPREQFTIARGLEDHTVSTTFYVRATIRNARTDELLDTINLVDSGDHHRYTYTWQTPADVSGEGFWILVTTSVYTDSGYTTKSTAYGDKYDEYLVMQRVNQSLGPVSGGDVDYKRIQKMIDEAVSKYPQPEKIVIPRTDLSPVLDAVAKVDKLVSSIQIPEQKEPDLTGLMAKVDRAIAAAENKEMTDTQMQPLNDLHQRMSDSLSASHSKLQDSTTKASEMIDKIREFFTQDVDKIMGGFDDVKKHINDLSFVSETKIAKPETKADEETP